MRRQLFNCIRTKADGSGEVVLADSVEIHKNVKCKNGAYVDVKSCFTQRRKGSKGAKGKPRFAPLLPLRLCVKLFFAFYILNYLQVSFQFPVCYYFTKLSPLPFSGSRKMFYKGFAE